MRWGERLEFTAEAGPGDFIYVPPYVPHQEINASRTETLECVLVRSDGEAVAINLDIDPAGTAGGRAVGGSHASRRPLKPRPPVPAGIATKGL
jgi:oxalate decarboxylase/phosphoglucose isomerase-like protein (cupin superfamily)